MVRLAIVGELGVVVECRLVAHRNTQNLLTVRLLEDALRRDERTLVQVVRDTGDERVVRGRLISVGKRSLQQVLLEVLRFRVTRVAVSLLDHVGVDRPAAVWPGVLLALRTVHRQVSLGEQGGSVLIGLLLQVRSVALGVTVGCAAGDLLEPPVEVHLVRIYRLFV